MNKVYLLEYETYIIHILLILVKVKKLQSARTMRHTNMFPYVLSQMLVPLVMLLGGMIIGFIVLLSELRRNKVSKKEQQNENVLMLPVMEMFHMMSHISYPRQNRSDDNISIVSVKDILNPIQSPTSLNKSKLNGKMNNQDRTKSVQCRIRS